MQICHFDSVPDVVMRVIFPFDAIAISDTAAALTANSADGLSNLTDLPYRLEALPRAN
jgi:hypothetical protein